MLRATEALGLRCDSMVMADTPWGVDIRSKVTVSEQWDAHPQKVLSRV